MGAGPHHLVRVRVEGDHHHRQPELRRDLGGPADDALMAQVHAVEDPDGDHGRAPAVGHLVQALPALHVRFLPGGVGGDAPSLPRQRPAGPGCARALLWRSHRWRTCTPAAVAAHDLVRHR